MSRRDTPARRRAHPTHLPTAMAVLLMVGSIVWGLLAAVGTGLAGLGSTPAGASPTVTTAGGSPSSGSSAAGTAPAAAVGPQADFSYAGHAIQQFVVPAGVHQIQITAEGGAGGAGESFSNVGETPAPGGPGGEVTAGLAVTPGEALDIDVGGAGGTAGISSPYGATPGGITGGDVLDGGAGGAGVPGSAAPSGGGGGGTAVIEAQSGLMVLAAGGGGGGGGGGVGDGSALNGGAGGTATASSDFDGIGNGTNGVGSQGDAGVGGLFSSTETSRGASAADASGGGGAGGGGGGGFLDTIQGNLGGGLAGTTGSTAGGGGGGGGAGDSGAWSGTQNASYGTNGGTDGSVTITWQPSDSIAVSAQPFPTVAVGRTLTYTATVTTSGGVPAGGTVSFSDGNQPISGCRALAIAPSPPDSATAICKQAYTAPGTHSVTASYSGSGTGFGAFPPSTTPSPLVEQARAVGTLFVATNGTDAGNTSCTSATPCASVSHALSEAIAGDTVSIGAGTFPGGFSVGLPVTIEGEGGQTVIAGPAAGPAVTVVHPATIENLRLLPSGPPNGPSTLTPQDGIDVSTSSAKPVSIAHVTVTGGDFGVQVRGARSAAAITASTINGAQVGVGAVKARLVTVSTSSIAGSAGFGVENASGRTVRITDTTVSGTLSGLNSGFGVWNQGGTLSITDSTVTSNGGGGLLAQAEPSGTPETTNLVDSTVAGNGGPGIQSSAGAAVDVAGTILATNSGRSCQGSIDDAGYNLADDATCGLSTAHHDVTGNPLLGALQSNGGPTPTEAPASTSPAVDSVPPGTQVMVGGTSEALCAGTDQRGVPRPEPSNGACDRGAVELAPSSAGLSVNPPAPTPDQAVKVAISVAGAAPAGPPLPEPRGDATVTDRGVALPGCATVPVAAGKATCRTNLQGGTRKLAVTFQGTNGYLSSVAHLRLTVAAG